MYHSENKAKAEQLAGKFNLVFSPQYLRAATS
jgi:hypothetical protein